MALLNGSYNGRSIIISNEKTGGVIHASVSEHFRDSMTIEVRAALPGLKVGDQVGVLVMTPGRPHEYQGNVTKVGFLNTIALFSGQEKENRKSDRFKADIPGQIESLVYDGEAFALHTPLPIRLIDISTTGALMRTVPYAMAVNAVFGMRLVVGDREDMLTAEVVRTRGTVVDTMDYGCRFIGGAQSKEE